MTHALCDGVHAASGGIDATAAIKPDSLSWGAGIECEAAKGGPSGVTGGDRTGTRQRWQQPACREREGTHALGAIFEAVIEEAAAIARTRHPPGAGRAAATACTGPEGGSV